MQNSRICRARSGWSRTQCPPPHTGSYQSCWALQAQPGWSLQGQHQQSAHNTPFMESPLCTDLHTGILISFKYFLQFEDLLWCWGIFPWVCGRCLWWSHPCLLLPPACPLYLMTQCQSKIKTWYFGIRALQRFLHTITLLQDLLSRGVIVSQRVAWVTVLVQDVRVWDLIFKAPSHTNVRLWWVEASTCWCTDNLSSKCSQYIHLYLQNTAKTWIKVSKWRRLIRICFTFTTTGDTRGRQFLHYHGKKISRICSLV